MRQITSARRPPTSSSPSASQRPARILALVAVSISLALANGHLRRGHW